jgi:flagellar biosynthesis component FlhA
MLVAVVAVRHLHLQMEQPEQVVQEVAQMVAQALVGQVPRLIQAVAVVVLVSLPQQHLAAQADQALFFSNTQYLYLP